MAVTGSLPVDLIKISEPSLLQFTVNILRCRLVFREDDDFLVLNACILVQDML